MNFVKTNLHINVRINDNNNIELACDSRGSEQSWWGSVFNGMVCLTSFLVFTYDFHGFQFVYNNEYVTQKEWMNTYKLIIAIYVW